MIDYFMCGTFQTSVFKPHFSSVRNSLLMATYEPTDGYLSTVVTDHLCKWIVIGLHFSNTRENNNFFPPGIVSPCLGFMM